ncbi:hypothetical protein BDZ91DRAFT_738097 [Kalaharituber pfeilii]|nr:hypothetical protein BDZ91DRAFT_738097 [Kalaharituber pfeilii]
MPNTMMKVFRGEPTDEPLRRILGYWITSDSGSALYESMTCIKSDTERTVGGRRPRIWKFQIGRQMVPNADGVERRGNRARHLG